MTKGKRILVVAVCLVVAAGGVTGGAMFYRAKQADKHQVDAVSVMNIADYYWGNDVAMDGTVVSGDVQNVILENDQMIDKVLVKEGDTVTVGTPLLDYDMTAVALDVAQKKTSLAVAEDNVRTAKKELERIKALRPSEEAPAEPIYPDYPYEPEEPDMPDTPTNTLAEITALTQAATGTGTAEDPYQFACTGTTVVRASVLTQLQSTNGCAVFVVYDETGTTLYAWLVRGDALAGVTPADWNVGEQVTITEDGGVQVNNGGVWYGTIQVGGTFAYDPAEPMVTTPATTPSETTPTETEPVETEPETTEESAEETEIVPTAMLRTAVAVTPLAAVSSDTENYMYTRAQLKQKIAEQEIAIKSAEIAQKRAQIDYDGAMEKQDNAQELSKIDGVVTKLAESVESLEQNEPYLVVQGNGGITVQGNISEMNLDKLHVGDSISVSSWDTGEMVMAEVTKIDTAPVSYQSGTYGENPNNSMYPFEAAVTETTSMAVGNYVSLSFSDTVQSDRLYIPVSYVRQENGQYYVMKANEENRLTKQVVQTGKIISGGYSIEIISGLSESDRICFPYGKYVTEGAIVKSNGDTAE